MFTFDIFYANGAKYSTSGITEVTVDTPNGISVIQSSEILCSKFPVPFESMRLTGPSKNVTVSGYKAIVVDASMTKTE